MILNFFSQLISVFLLFSLFGFNGHPAFKLRERLQNIRENTQRLASCARAVGPPRMGRPNITKDKYQVSIIGSVRETYRNGEGQELLNLLERAEKNLDKVVNELEKSGFPIRHKINIYIAAQNGILLHSLPGSPGGEVVVENGVLMGRSFALFRKAAVDIGRIPISNDSNQRYRIAFGRRSDGFYYTDSLFVIAHELSHTTQSRNTRRILTWREAYADILAYLVTKSDSVAFFRRSLFQPTIRTTKEANWKNYHVNSQLLSHWMYLVYQRLGQDSLVKLVNWIESLPAEKLPLSPQYSKNANDRMRNQHVVYELKAIGSLFNDWLIMKSGASRQDEGFLLEELFRLGLIG